MGVVKSHNPFALATGMGINCGLAGLTFFGMSYPSGRIGLMNRNEGVPSQPFAIRTEARENERESKREDA